MKKLLVLFFGLLVITPIFVGRVAAGEDETDDDSTVEEEEEPKKAPTEEPQSAAATSDKDAEEEAEVKPLEPHKDAETVLVFTDPANNKEFSSGKTVRLLVSFLNKGEKDFTVDSMEASFRYPMDYSFYIQNYTGARYEQIVQGSQEATFDYSFTPTEHYAGRPFGLVVLLNYRDAEGANYQNAVFNETVNIVEDESGFNPETVFLYVIFACIVVVLLLLGQQFLSKMRRKHGMTKKSYPAVEMGTGNKHEVDYEWIPREVLNHAKKSPGSPGKSPRNRKAARRTGSDD